MGPGVEGKEAGLLSEAEVEAGSEDGARPEAEAVGRATSLGMGEAVVNTIDGLCHLVKCPTASVSDFFFDLFTH